jgi:hypothetical protein
MAKFAVDFGDEVVVSDLADPLRQWGGYYLSMQQRLQEGHLLDSGSNSNGLRHVLKERGTTHGNWIKQSEGAQRIKAAFEDCSNWAGLKPSQKEALQSIATKISRILHGNPDERDHWADIAGYADLIVAEIDVLPR